VLLVALLLGLLYWQIVSGMFGDWWEDPNYSHGFLVPIFSGWLVWQERVVLRSVVPTGSWLGLAVLLAGLGELSLGVLGAEDFLMRSSLIVVLAGLVLFHVGGRTLRIIAFPLAFLLFMVPLPQIAFNAVAFPLQTLAAQNATLILDWIGVPVLRDGNVIHLSRISLGVAEACSGIRSLISLLAVAVAWAHLSLSRSATRILLVASAVPITIVANAGRIVSTGLIAQWFGMRYAEGFFHGFSGWLIFLVAFACLLGVQTVLSTAETWRCGGVER